MVILGRVEEVEPIEVQVKREAQSMKQNALSADEVTCRQTELEVSKP